MNFSNRQITIVPADTTKRKIAEKASIVATTHNIPGIKYAALAIIKDRQINMLAHWPKVVLPLEGYLNDPIVQTTTLAKKSIIRYQDIYPSCPLGAEITALRKIHKVDGGIALKKHIGNTTYCVSLFADGDTFDPASFLLEYYDRISHEINKLSLALEEEANDSGNFHSGGL